MLPVSLLTFSEIKKYSKCSALLRRSDKEGMALLHAMNNKGADHPAHPHSLINDFVIRPLGSIITIDS